MVKITSEGKLNSRNFTKKLNNCVPKLKTLEKPKELCFNKLTEYKALPESNRVSGVLFLFKSYSM